MARDLRTEVPPVTVEMLLLCEFMKLEADYWYEVDHRWGRSAHTYYVADGVFTIGDRSMNGIDAIASFYKWREERGERTARHVVTNFRLAYHENGRAEFECILNLYASDGRPPLRSEPAIMIADIRGTCVRADDGRWRFRSHVLDPIFTSDTPATIPPA